MSIDTDYGVLRNVLATHQPEGWAVEFGVYTGFSTKIIAEHMPVIGFDSFDGLPEDWRDGFPKGKFGDRKVGRHLSPGLPFNILLVKGWFDETVPTFPFPPLGLVHIDCDLYSSTVTALNGVAPHISEGTIIVFDEFHGYPGSADHEARAWDEFVREHEVRYEHLMVGSEELAVRITRVGA